MSSGLKITFETHKGERVERKLKAIWSTECLKDLKAFHTDATGEDMKRIVAGMVADAITTEFVMDVLTEFEKQAK